MADANAVRFVPAPIAAEPDTGTNVVALYGCVEVSRKLALLRPYICVYSGEESGHKQTESHPEYQPGAPVIGVVMLIEPVS